MNDVPTDPAHLTAEWLTETLRGHGHLHRGAIAAVEQTGVTHSYVATHVRLAVRYTPDTPGNAPARLFAKLSQEHPALGPKEVEFYSRMRPLLDTTGVEGSFLPCFGYGHDPVSLRAFLLLADVSETQAPGQLPLPPTQRQCEQAIDILAQLHAHFFEDAATLERLCELPDAVQIDGLIADAVENGAAFLEVMGDRLSPKRQDILRQLCAVWPRRRLERTLNRVGITLVHRDAHGGNFLFPLNPEGRTFLIDWDAWRVQTGTDDLAYFIAAAWYPDLRARWEMPLLRRYHTGISAWGVDSYTWDDCLLDYRESIIRNLLTFVGGYRVGRTPALWWERVEKLLMAYDEWDCDQSFTK